MTIKEKIQINKSIRKYDGKNPFLISLKKQLKVGKFVNKVDNYGKIIKVLSDKQYETAIALLS